MRKVLRLIGKLFKRWSAEPLKSPEWIEVSKKIVKNNLIYGICGDKKIKKIDASYIVEAEKLLDTDAKKIFYSLPLHRVIPLSKRIVLKKLSKKTG